LSNAQNLATVATGLAAAGRRAASSRALAEFTLHGDVEAARDAWAEIRPNGHATPYQNERFVQLWLETVGRADQVEPLIVVAQDARGCASAILPLAVRSRAGLRLGEFVGGKHANFHMGVFRAGLIVDRDDLVDFLRRVAKSAQLDAFLFVSQPETWRGAANPFTMLGGQPSPSFAYATQIRGEFDHWLQAHYSKDAQKKLRKKARRLAERGPISCFVARDEKAAREILAAFFAHKKARAETLGVANDFDHPAAARFLEIAACDGLRDGGATIELRALRCGERIVAVFGGLAYSDRFCGMITSFDPDPDIARSSPGELLILEIVHDLHKLGFAAFDLGVGEARYKDVCCERTEPLFDTALAFTLKGHIGAAVFRIARRAKRWIKQRPWAWSLAARVLKRGR
jgi:CelD/BcsL family acetyltransferase involved in cellulose biosynthesis